MIEKSALICGPKRMAYPKNSSIATKGDDQVHFGVKVQDFLLCHESSTSNNS